MKITARNTDSAILLELGRRLERTRLERNLTQEELAAEAGISHVTLQRVEAGKTQRLSSFLRVLRALGLLEALDRLVPEPVPSPIERLKLHGKQRRRASTPRSKPDEKDAPKPWRWGDEPQG